MKRIILSISLIILCFAAYAQNSPGKETTPGKPFDASQLKATEKLPEFPGGTEALYHFLSENVKYPKEAQDKKIQGRVVVKFMINNDGRIMHAEVTQGIGGGCDEEALRVINAMPKWKPGYQDGRPIKVYFALPVSFKLRD